MELPGLDRGGRGAKCAGEEDFWITPLSLSSWWCLEARAEPPAACVTKCTGLPRTDGFPTWLSGKESACQCRRHRFDPWVGKIPWRREWQPTPVFLPGESHGQRSLVGYSVWGYKELDMTEQLSMHTCPGQRDFWEAGLSVLKLGKSRWLILCGGVVGQIAEPDQVSLPTPQAHCSVPLRPCCPRGSVLGLALTTGRGHWRIPVHPLMITWACHFTYSLLNCLVSKTVIRFCSSHRHAQESSEKTDIQHLAEPEYLIPFKDHSFPGDSDSKESACNAGNPGSIPGLGGFPGKGNGNPLQYSCLENMWTEEPGELQSMGSQRVRHDWATNTFTFTFIMDHCLVMAKGRAF